jgi:hypothetical protein
MFNFNVELQVEAYMISSTLKFKMNFDSDEKNQASVRISAFKAGMLSCL